MQKTMWGLQGIGSQWLCEGAKRTQRVKWVRAYKRRCNKENPAQGVELRKRRQDPRLTALKMQDKCSWKTQYTRSNLIPCRKQPGSVGWMYNGNHLQWTQRRCKSRYRKVAWRSWMVSMQGNLQTAGLVIIYFCLSVQVLQSLLMPSSIVHLFCGAGI